MDVFLFSFNAIMPIVLLAALGFYLHKKNFFNAAFFEMGNAFTFKYGLPALLFTNVYKIEGIQAVRWDIMIFVLASTLAIFALGLIWIGIAVRNPLQKGVILQTFFRSNYAIIGIPLSQSLGGAEGASIAALLSAFAIPLYNILGVFALTIFLPESKKSGKTGILSIIRQIITNPLVLGTLGGFICLLIRPFTGGWTLRDGHSRFLFSAIESLGRIASPFALIMLGGQFNFAAAKHMFSQIVQGVLIRLVIAPLLLLSALNFIFPHFGAAEYAALLSLFASPAAVSTAIMAQHMHNDGELARQLVVWTAVCSIFTLFCFTAFFRAAGRF